MAKSILNIQADNTNTKHSLKLFKRSIAHSFKTTNERQKMNKVEIIEKSEHKNLFYFKDKIFTNEKNITNEIVEHLEKELEPFKEQWEKQKKNRTYNIPWTKMINGANDKNIFNETIIEISNDFHKDIDRTDLNFYEKFFQQEIEIYKANFKKVSGQDLNIIGASLHLDETTPHIHLFTHNVYLEKDKRSNEPRHKVSFKLNEREMFSELQDLQQKRIEPLSKQFNINVEIEELNKISEKPLSEKYKRLTLLQMKQNYQKEKIKVQKELDVLADKNERATFKTKRLTTRNEILQQDVDNKEKIVNQLENKITDQVRQQQKIEIELSNLKWWNWLSKRKNLSIKNNIQQELKSMNKNLNEYQEQLIIENKKVETIKKANDKEIERQQRFIKENNHLIEIKQHFDNKEVELEKWKKAYKELENEANDSIDELVELKDLHQYVFKKLDFTEEQIKEMKRIEEKDLFM